MTQKLFTKNFVLLILGQLTSLFGNFILKLALSMYVLEKTGSAAIFAGILSLALIPAILLSPLGGILADRGNRRNIMVSLDAFSGISVCSAAFLISEKNDLAVICTLLFALSIFGAFETPTVQACIPTMLEGDNITKGNAIVNQIASLSYLTAPVLGGVCYAAFGLKTVMYASVVCFFATALFECFIKINVRQAQPNTGGILAIVKQDFLAGMHYISKEQPDISKMLLLTAISRFFVMGITIIGLPYLVRNILGLGAVYYGAAESALAVATIIGSIAAGLLSTKLKIHRLSTLFFLMGVFILPVGVSLFSPVNTTVKYMIHLLSFCGIQITISIFSVFAVSLIQQRTPNHLIGKVMAFTSVVTLCVQPFGQLVYGFLFDRFRSSVSLILILSGGLICVFGLLTTGFFADMEKKL